MWMRGHHQGNEPFVESCDDSWGCDDNLERLQDQGTTNVPVGDGTDHPRRRPTEELLNEQLGTCPRRGRAHGESLRLPKEPKWSQGGNGVTVLIVTAKER